MWAKAYRDFPHANQETNSAIESYHGFFKTKYLCDHRRKSSRCMDWLMHTLIKKVELYYWNNQNIKDVGFSTNFKLVELKETSWSRACNILHSDCNLHPTIQNAYWVRSQSMRTRSKRYIVRRSDIIGSLFAVCDCPWAKRDNICKHVIRINLLTKEQQFHVNSMQHVSSPSLPTNIVFKAPVEIRSNVKESVHDMNDQSFIDDIVTNFFNDVDLADIIDGDDYSSIISSYQENLKILMEHPPKYISTARSVK
eukprot:Gb_02646 [translate_table: standard]